MVNRESLVVFSSPSEIQASTVARRVKHFPVFEPRCWGELENVPRTASADVGIFVGAPFFGLPFLGVKKGNWGPGQSPD
jgi:hypothetical protein